MKREIKFRGKSILTDKWVYGDLLHLGNAYVIVTSYEEEELEVNPISDRLEIRVEDIVGVYPETVGQFTGLLDKNGKEIYEGDVIRSYDSKNNPITHSISWDNKKACYVATMLQYPLLGGSIDKGWIDEFEKEVIGNIFDNPELLKGGAE